MQSLMQNPFKATQKSGEAEHGRFTIPFPTVGCGYVYKCAHDGWIVPIRTEEWAMSAGGAHGTLRSDRNRVSPVCKG
jgi:hypothetical protein